MCCCFTMKLFLIVFYVIFLNINEIPAEEPKCTKNSDCTTSKSICISGSCVCDKLSNLDTELNECLPYVTEFQGYCKISDQCIWLGSNASCSNNMCTCEENYRWYQGTCMKYSGKGESCEQDLNCFDGIDPLALQCDENTKTCICSIDYYDRGNDCRPISQGTCAINMDCKSKTDICKLGICEKPDEMLESHPDFDITIDEKEIQFKTTKTRNLSLFANTISCNFDTDCRDMANSLCDSVTKTCRCDSNRQFLNDGNCLNGFGICDSEDKCDSYPNTECFKGVCVCKAGYFLNNKMCVVEIGMIDETITDNSQCSMRPAKVSENACFCKDYWFGDNLNRNCIKTTLQYTRSCLTNEWCNAMGVNSFCNLTEGQCQCTDYAKLNETSFYCEGKRPENICLRDTDCKLHETCENEKCKCIKHFSNSSVSGKCEPDVGGSCEIEGCTNTKNSGCLQGICKCYDGFLENERKCLKIAENWDDKCEISEQCQNFIFSDCDTVNNTCKCVTNYKRVDGQCWEVKEFGDSCMNELQCTKVLNTYYQCRNSKCVCPIGQTLDNGYCVNSSSNNIHSFLPRFFLLLLFVWII